MKKGQREAIKKTIFKVLVDLYNIQQIYTILNIQEAYEKKTYINSFSDISKMHKSFCLNIEMVCPKGVILKRNLYTFSIKKLKKVLKCMADSIYQYNGTKMGINYYNELTKIQKNRYENFKKNQHLVRHGLLKHEIYQMQMKLKKFINIDDMEIETYCLQSYEENILVNASGYMILENRHKYSLRHNIKIADYPFQLSLSGIYLCGKIWSVLYQKLLVKYHYKIQLLKNIRNKKLVDNLDLSNKEYFVLDFDIMGTILHEAIGHSLEISYKKNSPKRSLLINEKIGNNQINIYDSSKMSNWTNIKFDTYGNKRPDICLVQNGEVKNYLTGMMNKLTNDSALYCDRKEAPGNIPQNRMSTIILNLDNAMYENKEYQSLNDLETDLPDSNNLLYILGSRMGEFDLQNGEITIFPELIVSKKRDNYIFYKPSKFKLCGKKVINKIVTGYGVSYERHIFCVKNDQSVPASSIVNQFIISEKFQLMEE